MARSNQMMPFRQKETEISEWGDKKLQRSQGKKKSKFPYLKSTKKTEKRYACFLDFIN
jgi:hypothetical protein